MKFLVENNKEHFVQIVSFPLTIQAYCAELSSSDLTLQTSLMLHILPLKGTVAREKLLN